MDMRHLTCYSPAANATAYIGRDSVKIPSVAALRVRGVFDAKTSPYWAYKEAQAIVQIVVRDNNVEQALRALKKKMQREGTFREMKRRKFYEKPSEKRARQKAEAVRRARKLVRKRMQREGMI